VQRFKFPQGPPDKFFETVARPARDWKLTCNRYPAGPRLEIILQAGDLK